MSVEPSPTAATSEALPPIISSRIFQAPRERVFAAFADPAQLPLWWGPKGFTNTFHEFDLRPGGRWRFTMHGPNGATYENEKEFLEVVPPERVVFVHRQPIHHFHMTLTFEELGESTRLTWHMLFKEAVSFSKLQAFIAEKNEENFDRLEAHLAGTAG